MFKVIFSSLPEDMYITLGDKKFIPWCINPFPKWSYPKKNEFAATNLPTPAANNIISEKHSFKEGDIHFM